MRIIIAAALALAISAQAAEPAPDPIGCTLGPGDVCIEPPVPVPHLTEIPTLSEWGLIALTLAMGGLVAFGAAKRIK